MEVLKTEGLRKYYGTGENLVKALDGVDISVERGEFLAVVGTSGSGKSTLLHMPGPSVSRKGLRGWQGHFNAKGGCAVHLSQA